MPVNRRTAVIPHTNYPRLPALLRGHDRGVLLPEALITVAVVAVAVTMLVLVLAGAQNAQRSLNESLRAQQLLSQEVAFVRASPFDDVLQAPADTVGAPALCPLGATGSRASAQAITPTSTVREAGRTYTIERRVTWASTGDPATCDAVPNDRGDRKNTHITVSWVDRGGVTRSRSAWVVSSRVSDTSVGPQIVVSR